MVSTLKPGFTPVKFGTDGWRAIIGEDYTFANVRACAQGVADYVRSTGMAAQGFVVGYDTRFASEDFAAAVAEVVAANGIKVWLCDRACPTPAVSWNVLEKQAAGAAVITASHNPAKWNGFKYKPDYGGSASPEVVAELERRIAAAQASGGIKRASVHGSLREASGQAISSPRTEPGGSGRTDPHPAPSPADGRGVERFDPLPPYLAQLSRLVDLEAIKRSRLRIAVDSMHGAGAGIIARLLSGGTCQVIELRGERNPAFPGMDQPEPITQNLKELCAFLAAGKADVGLATDGDADRLGLVDERGHFLTQLQTFSLLALYFLDVLKERGPLVKSITMSSMVFRLGELYNVPVHETPVGFKYIGPIMIREKALVGGEESGGYGFRGHIPERDGVLSGLFILSMMVKLGKKPSELIDYLYSKVGPHHYDRIDIHFDPSQREAVVKRMQAARPATLDGSKVVGIDTGDGYRFRLADGSWSLVRFSGTEPLLRVYCETNSPERVKRLLLETRKLAGV
ncbi:MAG: phosphoglucomutase/phosphomannomutase family protein [Chloroflexi bacterium]|nr:phosphoglucomutase/phosphomannomutase family protein [Chloroflexota bacterium]